MTKPVFHRIRTISVVAPFRLRAVFVDGVEKDYDLRRWENRPEFSLLFRHPALQTAVRVEPGGYGISWNDDIDLSAEEIYWNGMDANCPNIGDYTEEREELHKDISIDDITASIAERKKISCEFDKP